MLITLSIVNRSCRKPDMQSGNKLSYSTYHSSRLRIILFINFPVQSETIFVQSDPVPCIGLFSGLWHRYYFWGTRQNPFSPRCVKCLKEIIWPFQPRFLSKVYVRSPAPGEECVRQTLNTLWSSSIEKSPSILLIIDFGQRRRKVEGVRFGGNPTSRLQNTLATRNKDWFLARATIICGCFWLGIALNFLIRENNIGIDCAVSEDVQHALHVFLQSLSRCCLTTACARLVSQMWSRRLVLHARVSARRRVARSSP